MFFRVLRALVLKVSNLLRRKPKPLPAFPGPEFQAENATANPAQPPRGAVTPEVMEQITRSGGFSAQGAPPRSAANTGSDPSRHAHSGGFGYIDDGTEVWATAYRYRPPQTDMQRLFGIGYFKTVITHRNLRVTRKVYAPFGDHPFLISEVEIENLGSAPAELRHYEYWDVNVHQLQVEWLCGGNFTSTNASLRREINRHFDASVSLDETASALRYRQQLRNPPPQQAKNPEIPSDIDWDPSHIFLADLDGQPDAVFIRQSRFFGEGGAKQPGVVTDRLEGDALEESDSGKAASFCLVMRRDMALEVGERKTLRYAYGSIRPRQNFDFLNPFRQAADPFKQTLDSWKQTLAYFYTGEDPVLHREMAWHTYNMLSSSVYSEFHKAHIIPQGSAYLYLHGADGAPRDQALFAIPAAYINPSLSRDMLRLIMQVTDAHSGQITYSFAGHGFISDALGIHTQPSDLDLFFLLALCEYLSATADFTFLDEEVPFYPPDESPEGAAVRDHVHMALRHLFTGLGIGEHGLLRVGSGDWSDSIVLETAIKDGPGPFGVTYGNSKSNGESVPNTQMALYVLPLLRALLNGRDPKIDTLLGINAEYPEGYVAILREGVRKQWNPHGWYNRAVLRNLTNAPVVITPLNLESQIWAMISGIAADDGLDGVLVENVDQYLDRPSQIGGTLLPGGMVWPAVSQLLTWGYARGNRGQLAWRSLNRNTFAMHSHTYPDIWINTWSGPDGINGTASDKPGGTWVSPVTPMTDFPVMNANQDAMALLGLLRVCGIEPAPTGDGLIIHPHVQRERFVLELPLLRLEVSPDRMVVDYHAVNDGALKLYLHHGIGAVHVRVDGEALNELAQTDQQVTVPIQFTKGQTVRIEMAKG